MKISRNWLNNYLVSNKTDEELVDLFTQLGLECGFNKIEYNFTNIIIGKVEACTKHPNADRLKVCNVNTGTKNLQIICGAPNVKEGLTVPVALVGAKIGDFIIKKTKIRGEESNGMICSGKELRINDDHEGIMELDPKFNAGDLLVDNLKLENDTIFDFDMTPNRGDCFSHLGIARELSIIEGKKIQEMNNSLKLSKFKTTELVNVSIKNKNICKRYACRIIKNVNVGDSPKWLKHKLTAIGENSINNIVDLANFVMFDLGQPLHIFDYDKIKSKEISIRLAENKESILCLDNNKKKLTKDDIVIADASGPIAIAGVIGGYDSQVDYNTKNILIESAIFDEIHIRKTSKRHNCSKEASKRFERSVDYNNVLNAMNLFAKKISELMNVDISEDYVDIKYQEYLNKNIKFDVDRCNKFLGTSLSSQDCKNIFLKLNISMKKIEDYYLCSTPSYRNDLEREVDLYEEIARVYGYDNIKSKSSFRVTLNSFVYDENEIENKIKNILSNNGFNEHYSNSLYDERDIEFGNHKNYNAVKLKNPLSSEMGYIRNSLVPGIMKALSFNEKREIDFLQLFEIGSVSSIDKKTYSGSTEIRELCIGYLGDKLYNWKNKNTFDIFDVKSDVIMLFNHLGLNGVEIKLSKNNYLDICLDNLIFGQVFIPDGVFKKKYDINSAVIIVSINIDELNKIYKNKKIIYKKYSQQPSVKRDIAILVKKNIKNEEILSVIQNSSSNLLKTVTLFDIYEDDKLDKDSKSLAYSLKFQSYNRTLNVNEVEKEIKLIIKNLKSKLNISQR